MEVITSLSGVATLIGALVTGAAALLTVYLGSYTSRMREHSKSDRSLQNGQITQSIRVDGGSLEQRRREHLERRLNDVSNTIRQLESETRINRLSNSLLITGQYVVGGALTSSFIQESLTNEVVGILGLLVLVATIIHQRARPDVRARIARQKTTVLQSTLRKAQDDLVSDNPNHSAVILLLSQALNEVENEGNWQIEETSGVARQESESR